MAVIFATSWGEIKAHLDRPNSKVLLMASASFCMPCRKLAPILEQVSNELPDKCVAIKTNLDECPDVNDFLGVGSVPTLIYWKDGKEIYRTIGSCTKEEMIAQILQFFS